MLRQYELVDRVLGYDPEADARHFTISDGIVVVPKGYKFA